MIDAFLADPFFKTLYEQVTGQSVPTLRVTAYNRLPSLAALAGEALRNLAMLQ